MRYSLRWLLPLVLITFTVAVAAWSYQTNGKIAEDEVEQDQLLHMSLEMDQLQRHIELELREGMMASVQEEISTLGVNPEVEIAFLSDHHDIVIASIFFASVGNSVEGMIDKYLSNSSGIRLEQFQQVKQSLSSRVFLEGEGENQKVIGIYPVVTGRQVGELRPTLIGLLYAQRSLAKLKAVALQNVVRQISQFSLVLALLTVFLCMFLHFQVTERIRKIVSAARLVSEGDLSVRTGISGNDELGEVASTMDQMVSRWAEAEAKLTKLSQGVEQSGESMVIMDFQGVVEYVNPAFSRLSGYSIDEVIGNLALWFKNSNDPVGRDLWGSMILGNPWHGRIINEKKDGSTYPSMLTVSPIRNDAGDLINYVAVQQDLSEHENLEEQFRQAQKMEALGTLVGGIAHEFNNSLAGMTGNLYLAKQGASQLPEVVARLEVVEKLSFRSAELIKNLLSFARKGIIQKTDIVLSTLLKEVIKIYQASLPEHIKLNTDIEATSVVVHGDQNLLQQSLMNIINNACDALHGVDDPSISIKLDVFAADGDFRVAHPECKPGNYASISIRDNGVGIKADDLPHIFEPFYTTKTVEQGAGLGLSMVYGALQSHGGAIEIDSAKDVGSLVRIYLPLVDVSAEEGAGSESSIVTQGQGERILLVDDNITLLSSEKAILESLNYKVLTASNGQEAIDLFNANMNSVDLVLMDVVMPVMGGVEAVRKLRELKPELKVVFSSGYDRENIHKSDGLGSETIISKPFKVEALSAALRTELDGHLN
ncbi:PAS domain S-box-containing protein [Mariprofundus aestuarium]|uniref:histidine kinase n=1 Tax=Mariprofundus aestuarium TaxID=1921086 RepID=A0A2K8KXB7_MARES|nr:ATP-binding protein [Mariprofundus aestuarium]ATX79567.1 PAS domain S-box-containing protein [Mariprofundus aestuarium]